MESRNSTPLEEEELDFQQVPPRDYPVSPVVIIQNQPSGLSPPTVPVRLPSPYPTFNASWPIPNVPQGPRAFVRSSMVFQPTTRQFRPLSVVTTSPPTSHGHVSDEPTTPPNRAPEICTQPTTSSSSLHTLYPLISTVSLPRGQPIPMVLSTRRLNVSQGPQYHTQGTVLSTQRLNVSQGPQYHTQGTLVDLTYDPTRQIYEARYPVPPEIRQPTSSTDSQTKLRERLVALE